MAVTGTNTRRGSSAAPYTWPLHSYLELPSRPDSVRAARRHTRNILREWELEALTETAELLVSEIATNAVRATDPAGTGEDLVRMWLTSDHSSVLIQVWDRDHRSPRPQLADPDAEAGRGLLLIEALSLHWGCQTSDVGGGKVVWAVCG
jgi:anti-sigma regulatory factor (Ser/Thr protein kinase)